MSDLRRLAVVAVTRPALALPILPRNVRRRASESYHPDWRIVGAVGMKQAYTAKRFRESSLSLIETMNAIVDDYQDQGFRLSMRQLFYQLVTINAVANTEREYNRILRLGTDARMAGLMDWDLIEDRGREFNRAPS